MLLLTLRDLQYRARRFAVSIIGTALVFSLVLVMQGLYNFFAQEPTQLIDAVGAQTWLVAEGVPGPFSAPAPKLGKAEVDGAKSAGASDAVPVLISRTSVTMEGEEVPLDLVVYGSTYDGKGANVLAPVAPPESGQLVVDAVSKMEVGDKVTVGGLELDVTGVTDGRTVFGNQPIAFMDLADANQVVTGQRGDRATAILVFESISKVDGTTPLLSADVAADAGRPLKEPTKMIQYVSFMLLFVAATIVGAIVYLSALERLRDFAVMKAVGASNNALLQGLVIQSVLVSVIASLVAILLAQVIGLFELPIPILIPPIWYVLLPFIAVVVGALASLGGLRKAVSVDPALAFTGGG